MSEATGQAPAGNDPELSILRVYLKDVSLETPNSPAIFTVDIRPETNIQIDTSFNELEEHIYEVVLGITVTATHQDKTIFLVEVQQAGIFMIKDPDTVRRKNMLGTYCPNTLYPYAREIISSLVANGGFPPLLLAPVNFDTMYAESMAEKARQDATTE